MLLKFKNIAQILGKKGLMPSAKNGTVSKNILQMVQNVRKGQKLIKLNKYGGINMTIGRISFKNTYIYNNFTTAFFTISNLISVKNSDLQVFLSTTMSPGIKINTDEFIKYTTKRNLK